MSHNSNLDKNKNKKANVKKKNTTRGLILSEKYRLVKMCRADSKTKFSLKVH
jgi:hypothetical protein